MIPQLNPQSLLSKFKSQPDCTVGRARTHVWPEPLVSTQPPNCTDPGLAVRALVRSRGPLDCNRAAHLFIPLRRLDHFAAAGSKSDGSASSSSPAPRARVLSAPWTEAWERSVVSHRGRLQRAALHALNALVRPPSEVHSSPTPVALVVLWTAQSTRGSEPLFSSSSAT